MIKKIIFPLFICFLFSCSTKKPEVDLIIHNAVIYTVDSSFTIQQAIAIKDGKIIETGSNEQILNSYSAKVVKDVGGKAIFPGFIDAHCHFLSYGLGLQQVDLVGTKSFEEVIQKVKEFKVQTDIPRQPMADIPLKGEIISGEWIIGRGWDQNDWDVKEYPNKTVLDSLFPNTPVILKRIDGHAALVNTKAMEIAGLYYGLEVKGGEIQKVYGHTDGKKSKDSPGVGLTGILIDNAVDLVTNKIPLPSKEKVFNALLAAQKNCFEVGLTTVDDAGLMKSEIDVINELQKNGKLKMRIYAMLSDSTPNYKYYLEKGPYKTDKLNVRSFKFYADGALGSRGACLLKDYSDKPKWKGFLLNTKEHFEKYAKILFEKGFQMNTHCIGDSAVRVILHLYNSTFYDKSLKKENTKAHDARWRIEHFQCTTPIDVEGLLDNTSNIIPSVQPTHATSDMYWAEECLGKERVKYAYAYKELLKAAGTLALGTDFPVEDVSPFKTFYAAVFRKDSKGFPKSGFQMENALTREETIKGMTIWAAYSNFEEKEKGSLEKNKFADFVILDTDLMKCNENKILSSKVIATYINGEKVFSVQ
ncbi:MAG TPA: amidohydrolase family protein [Bacteroidia bacterium]|jgi:predicted amidohydrolase YtcJ|nr:amidohydrolase family protein [Bacteroidia bacterium]